MRFLTDKDYSAYIRKWVQTIITGDSVYTLTDAEDTAIEIVSSYLRPRYDMAAIFKGVQKFVVDTQYSKGDIVISGLKIYVALVDDPGNTLTDEAKWQAADPRNKAVMMVVIDIALYNLHTNISPQNIPELRVKRYDDAMKWLEKVQKELISPDLPLLDATVPSATVRVGSNTKVTNRW